MQVTRYYEAERKSDTSRAVWTHKVAECKSKAASNYMNTIYVH